MPAPTTPADAILCGFDALGNAGVFLVAVGEEEHIQQRPIDRRAEQLGELLGLHLAGRLDVDAGGAEHHFQRGERGRVVALGLLLDVGAGRRAEEAEFGVADLDRLGPALAVAAEIARLLLRANHANRGGHEQVAVSADRNHVVGQSHRAPRRGHRYSRRWSPAPRRSKADHPRRARRAAPAGKQAELHFGKAEGRFLVVVEDRGGRTTRPVPRRRRRRCRRWRPR